MKIRNKSLRHRFLGNMQVYQGQEIEVDDSRLEEVSKLTWVQITKMPTKVAKKKSKLRITEET
jgi:hypothetical protein